jgi:hypothetical protein
MLLHYSILVAFIVAAEFGNTTMMRMRDHRQTIMLEELIGKSWDEFERLDGKRFVVRPSIPIPFFGDSIRYFQSELKVVTVGLNPSKSEFPMENPFLRFPKASACTPNSRRCDLSQHLAALDDYFRTMPYGQWFGSLEPILNGMNSSYYDNRPNAALHTDLGSPVATDPTWSRLNRYERSILEPEGAVIWHSLIEILEPDIILISVAERYLSQIRFSDFATRPIIWELTRARPYRVFANQLLLNTSKTSHCIRQGFPKTVRHGFAHR